MSQKTVIYNLGTPFMKAEALGGPKINKPLVEIWKKPLLATALMQNGWRFVENDFKLWLLGKIQTSSLVPDSLGQEVAIHKTDEIEAALDSLLASIFEFAEIYDPATQEALKESLYRVLCWEQAVGQFTYTAPEQKGTACLLKDVIDVVYFGVDPSKKGRYNRDLPAENRQNTDLTDKAHGSKYRKCIRHLFATEPSEEVRQELLKFAYLLKMTGKETHTYLTKWVFSDAIRWDNPWELAAAYEIECNPATVEDRGIHFFDHIKERIAINKDTPNAPENSGYLEFIQGKEQQEYLQWINSYQAHCEQNKQHEFLCHWAWLLLVFRIQTDSAKECSGNTQPAYRVISGFTQQQITQDLPGEFDRLCAYVRKYIPGVETVLTAAPDDIIIQKEIIGVMKHRHFRLMAATYVYASLDIDKPLSIPLQFEGQQILYRCPYLHSSRRSHFEAINELSPRYTTTTKDKKKLKVINRPSRSDIIRLGVELALTYRGINQLLEIGGFHPELYARDFFEYTLLRALYELEQANTFRTDGYRFSLGVEKQYRLNSNIDEARQAIQKQFQAGLERNFSQLDQDDPSVNYRNQCNAHRPKWVNYCIFPE